MPRFFILEKKMPKKIDEQQVRKVAKLARLALTDEEVTQFSSQLSDILRYVEKMDELDTAAVEPLAHCLPITNCLRDDQVRESLGTEKTLQNAPDHDDEYFRVPPILDENAGA